LLAFDGVLTQDQCLGFSGSHLLSLELRQKILLVKFPQQFLGILGVSFRRDVVLQLALRDYPRVSKLVDDGIEGKGHGLLLARSGRCGRRRLAWVVPLDLAFW
jgi:hypothetical protein